MMIGLLLGCLAGILISFQNTLNSKLNEQAGTWMTTTWVLGLGFLASFIIGFIVEGIDFLNLRNAEIWYWFSGVLGIFVVSCLMQGIRLLGATYAISIVLTSQIGFALVFDSLGLFGLEKIPFQTTKLLGVFIIISGIFVFKLDSRKRIEDSLQHKE
ncbi:DMT family transporter [Thermoactinomyces sp. DSM 45892]|uniref:DMT family transporter n=1 Tax=Thermoactinomyces sp. DSM 45892 TaxID=1882753 RepID=UPI0008996BAA|nr:DMT family transporter [Thermoactinomyces sp. DSM 45892]SDX97771.1 transporter family-2 protein [Thermoactinomyces sp. DSM 45892]